MWFHHTSIGIWSFQKRGNGDQPLRQCPNYYLHFRDALHRQYLYWRLRGLIEKHVPETLPTPTSTCSR